MAIYISIGNSDDKLTQAQWSEFIAEVDDAIRLAPEIHGRWFSAPQSPYQNACWCIDRISPDRVRLLKSKLQELASCFNQDSIAWADASTEFIGGG